MNRPESAQKPAYLYLHGGPGMNSLGEERILSPFFAQTGASISFWNEPSSLGSCGDPFRLERAFQNCVDSVRRTLIAQADRNQGSIHLLVFSFSIWITFEVLKEKECLERIASIHVISPTLPLRRPFQNVLKLAANDFRESAPENSKRILELVQASQSVYDDCIHEAFGIAANDPQLFTHYWQNPAQMGQFFAAWAEAGAQLDVPAFIAVMQDLDRHPVEPRFTLPLPFPVTFHFGELDVVVEKDPALAEAKKIFGEMGVHTYAGRGHYPHLEDPEAFVRNLNGLTTP